MERQPPSPKSQRFSRTGPDRTNGHAAKERERSQDTGAERHAIDARGRHDEHDAFSTSGAHEEHGPGVAHAPCDRRRLAALRLECAELLDQLASEDEGSSTA